LQNKWRDLTGVVLPKKGKTDGGLVGWEVSPRENRVGVLVGRGPGGFNMGRCRTKRKK